MHLTSNPIIYSFANTISSINFKKKRNRVCFRIRGLGNLFQSHAFYFRLTDQMFVHLNYKLVAQLSFSRIEVENDTSGLFQLNFFAGHLI